MNQIVKEYSVMILIVIWAFAVLQSCEPEPVNAQETTEDVAIWLARSCIGEAGFESAETGECAALMHIYLKRSLRGKFTLYEIVRKYSAATKKRREHPRKWIFDMSRSFKKPARFPRNLNWKWKHKPQWKRTVRLADDFLLGNVLDPVPEADHYGSIVDEHRAIKAGWIFIRTEFKNQFWAVPGAKYRKGKKI